MTYVARPLGWVLDNSMSCFADVVRERLPADPPADPVKVFEEGGLLFGLVQYADGRWVLMRLRPGPGPHPEGRR